MQNDDYVDNVKITKTSETDDELSVKDKKFAREKNLEDFTLLWCDTNVNAIAENRQIQIELRKSINYLLPFQTSSECQQYIEDHKDEKIVLIVSERLGSELVPEIHDLNQIIAIYVCDSNREDCKPWSSAYNKVVDTIIVTGIDLLQQLSSDQQERNDVHEQELPISVLEFTHSTLESDFMWFQLIIEVLLRMDSNHRTVTLNELIEMCKQQYDGNDSSLAIVNELENEYDANRAIWWYSRDTFLFRTLNSALRRRDIDILVRFCFFIQDLYQQLKNEQKFDENIFNVYRGQLMSTEEFERLKANEKRFVSINTFFSTTCNRQLALIFAGSGNSDQSKTSILFEIEVNTRLQGTKPFAAISHLSAFGDIEEEVLFTLGSIFKIIDISWNEEESVCIIKMLLAGEEENELRPIFESMKNEVTQETDFLSVGNIYHQMGKYNEADKYYKRLLNSLQQGDLMIPRCYTGLGHNNREKGDYDSAYSYYTKSLELELKVPFPHQKIVATNYLHIGGILMDKQDYEGALENLSKALDIYLKTFEYNNLLVAGAYGNIGNVHRLMDNYDLALSNYNKCLEIQLRLLPDAHPRLAETLHNLAIVHCMKKEYELAMLNYKKALSIQLLCIPNHASTAHTYQNIGRLLLSTSFQNYPEALSHFEKALNVYRTVLPENHLDIARILVTMSQVYVRNEEYQLAMKNLQKGLSMLSMCAPNHLDTAETHNLMGEFYQNNFKNRDEALLNYEKALQIYQNVASGAPPPQTAKALFNIGMIYYEEEKYGLAIDNLKQALAFQLISDPSHEDTAIMYNNIGHSQQMGFNYHFTALINYQQALNIYQNDCSLPPNHTELMRIQNNIQVTEELLTRGSGKF